MSGARDQILGAIRHSLKRGPRDAAARADLDARRPAGRGNGADAPDSQQLERFTAKAEAVSATVARIEAVADLPGEIARYLAAHNLPAEVVATPDTLFDQAEWGAAPMLTMRRGTPGPAR